jgi:hypothetical protein
MCLERTASDEARDAIVLDAAGRDLEYDEGDTRGGLKAIDGGLA